jgi:hypothetical protein
MALSKIRDESTDGSVAGGKVLQVVQGQKTSRSTITSTSFVDVGLSVNITPSSTSSKILIMASASGNSESSNNALYFTVYRDSTNLGGSNGTGFIESPQARLQTPVSVSTLDSPATTSQINYSIRVRTGSSTVEFPATPSEVASIVVMEIAG